MLIGAWGGGQSGFITVWTYFLICMDEERLELKFVPLYKIIIIISHHRTMWPVGALLKNQAWWKNRINIRYCCKAKCNCIFSRQLSLLIFYIPSKSKQLVINWNRKLPAVLAFIQSTILTMDSFTFLLFPFLKPSHVPPEFTNAVTWQQWTEGRNISTTTGLTPCRH